MSLTLEVSHFDMLGNDTNALHSANIELMSLTLEVSHFDISGKDFKELHL